LGKIASDTTVKESSFRYERKYLIPRIDSQHVLSYIKQHHWGFFTPFPPRFVNNIYFDTLGLKAFHENVEGVSNRKKTRIRWYGEQLGTHQKLILERKIKNGAVGFKELYPLLPFTLDDKTKKLDLELLIKESKLPKKIQTDLLFQSPILINRYHRSYFLSRDGGFRLTLDNNIQYQKFSFLGNSFLHRPKKQKGVLIELKYALEDDIRANEISSSLPFTLTKNSKYVSGIYHLYGRPN
jgi:hypothetical protein